MCYDNGSATWTLIKEHEHQGKAIETYGGTIPQMLKFLWMRWSHQLKVSPIEKDAPPATKELPVFLVPMPFSGFDYENWASGKDITRKLLLLLYPKTRIQCSNSDSKDKRREGSFSITTVKGTISISTSMERQTSTLPRLSISRPSRRLWRACGLNLCTLVITVRK